MSNIALEQGEGILRLAPAWVPRSFCIPGKRLKLHPEDLYAYGAHRGGIDERWLSSTTRADNGPLTTPDEGLSYVVYENGGALERKLLLEMVDEMGAALIGDELWSRYHSWPAYSKFFDNRGALPHHLHPRPEHAAQVGQQTKPESYFFPAQMNNYAGDFPYTFFGLEPGTRPDEVRHCLEIWEQGDNHITALSRAYRLEAGSGWYVPPGVLHAPGSMCTYEPQWASDVFAMFQSLVNEVPTPWELLVKSVPPDRQHNLDYLVSLVDFEANCDPNFKQSFFRPMLPVRALDDTGAVLPREHSSRGRRTKGRQEPPGRSRAYKGTESEGYIEHWISYRNPYFAAKELTVLPGRSVVVRDSGPYGVVVIQGHGTMGVWPVETPALIRFGQLTYDEFFVSAAAAQEGVRIHNPSKSDPLVILKQFGPHPEAERL